MSQAKSKQSSSFLFPLLNLCSPPFSPPFRRFSSSFSCKCAGNLSPSSVRAPSDEQQTSNSSDDRQQQAFASKTVCVGWAAALFFKHWRRFSVIPAVFSIGYP